MWAPYASNFPDAVTIANTSTAAFLTAIVWRTPLSSRLASVLFVAALFCAASVTFEPQLLKDWDVLLAPDHYLVVLRIARFLAVAAFVLARPRWLSIPVFAGALALGAASSFVKESEAELGALHLLFFGLAYGVSMRLTSTRPARAEAPPTSHRVHDTIVFAVAVLLAIVVSVVVLERFAGSGDEWGYTYDADLFAHLRAYAPVPPCETLFKNWWVFHYQGRTFPQYTPGWPLFMAPFQLLNAAWLAAPVAFGAMVVGIARVARRVAAGNPAAGGKEIRIAGTVAAALAMVPVGVLLNAGSRYPHVATVACFAWSVECACVIATKGMSSRRQWLWGFGLGCAAGLSVCIRPQDGGLLSLPVLGFLVYALVRRRIGWRSLAGATLGAGVLVGVTLVVLRLQLGEWFKTGYQIAGQFSPIHFGFSVPKPNEWKWGLPLGTGSFCWWPCAPAIGACGLVLARGSGRAAALMLMLAPIPLAAFYVMLEFGRDGAAGYGPRYHLPYVVSMAVGGALLLSPLLRAALSKAKGRSAFRVAGPPVLAAAAAISGVLRIAPLMYLPAHAEAHDKDATYRAVAREGLKHAVVTVNYGDLTADPLDLVQNLPSVPEPDVLYLYAAGDMACGRREFGDRYWYRATGKKEVELLPY